MADVKIQDLLSTTTVADTDLFIVEDNADTKKITKANLVETLGINGKAPTVHTHSMSQITDYEQGTWTPILRGLTTAGSGTYSVQEGRYTKVGNKVSFGIRLIWSAHSGTGGMIVSLPFTSAPGTFNPCTIVASNLTFSNQLSAMIGINENIIVLYQFGSGVALTTVNMDTNATLFISGTYFI